MYTRPSTVTSGANHKLEGSFGGVCTAHRYESMRAKPVNKPSSCSREGWFWGANGVQCGTEEFHRAALSPRDPHTTETVILRSFLDGRMSPLSSRYPLTTHLTYRYCASAYVSCVAKLAGLFLWQRELPRC